MAKYALSLELTDDGFDYSVLSEFRKRLIDGEKEQVLFEIMLRRFESKGGLKAKGKQRTDSTHVLSAVRRLNRLEKIGETLRAALNRLATITPQWLNDVVTDEWYDRYGRRIEDYRLPKEKEARNQFAKTIGKDGLTLLDAIYAPDAPESLKQLDEVEILRQTWVEQFFVINDQIQLRDAKDLPPAHLRLESPYDPDARYSSKGSRDWVGYKVHITETCDSHTPHLITCVQTTLAPVQDVTMTPVIHEQLAQNNRLPNEHFADAGYVSAEMLVNSQKNHQVQLVGPAKADGSWQAKQNAGYSLKQFDIDFEHQCVTCPPGETTTKWRELSDQRGKPVIHAKFHRSTCQPCSARSLCTRSQARSLAFRPAKQHLALVAARSEQKTEAWKKNYNKRAGIEGTFSQGVGTFGLREARYIGLAKTRLQHVLTASAINIVRLTNWLNDVPFAKTRVSHFAKLPSQIAA